MPLPLQQTCRLCEQCHSARQRCDCQVQAACNAQLAHSTPRPMCSHPLVLPSALPPSRVQLQRALQSKAALLCSCICALFTKQPGCRREKYLSCVLLNSMFQAFYATWCRMHGKRCVALKLRNQALKASGEAQEKTAAVSLVREGGSLATLQAKPMEVCGQPNSRAQRQKGPKHLLEHEDAYLDRQLLQISAHLFCILANLVHESIDFCPVPFHLFPQSLRQEVAASVNNTAEAHGCAGACASRQRCSIKRLTRHSSRLRLVPLLPLPPLLPAWRGSASDPPDGGWAAKERQRRMPCNAGCARLEPRKAPGCARRGQPHARRWAMAN